MLKRIKKKQKIEFLSNQNNNKNLWSGEKESVGVFLPPSFFSLTSLFESSLLRVSVPQGFLPVLSLLLTDSYFIPGLVICGKHASR